MSEAGARRHWRVGSHADPVGFPPLDLCAWNHRFDDRERRFRSIYGAESAETAIREVLADLRPNAAAIRRYVERFGPEAAGDVPGWPVTESWRQQHVLVEVRAHTEGPVVDLCDGDVRNDVERRHGALLEAHGMDHLDLSEITARRRAVTQAIAADLHDRVGAAGIRFPSRLDGSPCLALFEGRSTFVPVGDPILLVDPAPEALRIVCDGWRLDLSPASALAGPG